MMEQWKIMLLVLGLTACSAEQKGTKGSDEPKTGSTNGALAEHKLKNFFINAEAVAAQQDAGVNDLKVDYNKKDNLAMVAFDCEVPVGCTWKGGIKTSNDTVYLYYYQHCEEDDAIVTESREMRFYYEITNGTGLRKKILVPRLTGAELD